MTAPVQHGSNRHLMTTKDLDDVSLHDGAVKMTSKHKSCCLVASVTKTSLPLSLSSLSLSETMKLLLLKETVFEHLDFFFSVTKLCSFFLQSFPLDSSWPSFAFDPFLLLGQFFQSCFPLCFQHGFWFCHCLTALFLVKFVPLPCIFVLLLLAIEFLLFLIVSNWLQDFINKVEYILNVIKVLSSL